MTAHRVFDDMALANWWTTPATGDVLTSSSNRVENLIIAASASETNTVADPQNAGLFKLITVYSLGSGGTRAITFNSAFDSQGNTVITFAAVRQSALFMSVPDSTVTSGYRWEIISSEGILLYSTPIYQNYVLGTAVTSTSTTAAAITGLVGNVIAGKTYAFEANILCTLDATSGGKWFMNGSATATTVGYSIEVIGASGVDAFGNETALGTGGAVSYNTDTAVSVTIAGSIVVNAAGTLGPYFGLKAGSTTGTALVMSNFYLTQTA